MNARQNSVDLLERRIKACRLCRDAPTYLPQLPHEPRPVAWLSSRAKILIAGQAPGTRVHASGKPFDDRSGDRLRDWLGVSHEQFYDRDNFAIVPMGFCFPGQDVKGGDLPPRRECAPTWRSAVLATMPQIELVLAIGQYAHHWHLKALKERTLTETVMKWRSIYEQTMPRPVLALPHPSWRTIGWAKKHPWFEDDLLPFVKEQVRQLLSST
ncbi:uracil-DNA glycosylase family protein [Nitratireductor basaltis]|uniref:Uracil-DNA glycosylase-like domain-containing protein n=1 Tax=Nitratireductor basaltis TaxID=472175 RepID=A0A084UAY3_9HYPH|nr:uracil-DNA glycosylase family protein [Nitratireductor basaltis]KFB10119.1 hypothetical protein EL18_01149 [Nitratireductor basaltis]